MATHKYRVGQEVMFQPGVLQTGSRRDPYLITRLLPEEAGILQYRIKHGPGGLERVVPEGQISPLETPHT